MVKKALSNPFAALGAAISFGCGYTCNTYNPETRLTLYGACETVKLFSQLGSVLEDIKSIIDEGFKIRQDYCSRLKESDKTSSAASVDSSGTGFTPVGTTKK